MNNVELNLSLPCEGEYDVIVIGGGSAGCFAAIQAGRLGAKTLLIEKNGILGGTITVANVNFPGLFHAWGRQIIAGACFESIERTVALGGAELPDTSIKPLHHWQHQIRLNKFIYASVLDDMCQESGVELYLHTMVAYAQENEKDVTLIYSGKDGMHAVHAKFLIDATGDANIVQMLGYPLQKSKHLQPGTLYAHLGGYALDNIDFEKLKNRFQQALAKKTVFDYDCASKERPFFNELREGKVNMHVVGIDASTSIGKTGAELVGRTSLKRILSFLRTVEGCENIVVSDVADECGIRETNRIVGEESISCEDYVSGKRFDSAVCYSFYPIDRHLHDSSGIKQQFLKEGIVPTVPYGALIPKGSKQIFAAGRCISGDADAGSAYRVQATCMATGQVAGVAAYLAAKHGIASTEVNYSELCSKLREQNAVVPD